MFKQPLEKSRLSVVTVIKVQSSGQDRLPPPLVDVRNWLLILIIAGQIIYDNNNSTNNNNSIDSASTILEG